MGDASVGLVALARGAELDEVMDLAQVPGEEGALLVRQGEDVLGLSREVCGDGRVCGGGLVHARAVRVREAVTLDLGRRAVPVERRGLLGCLGDHPVPLDVAVGAKIHQDVQGIRQVLQCA